MVERRRAGGKLGATLAWVRLTLALVLPVVLLFAPAPAAAGVVVGLRPFVVPGGARIVVLADAPPADSQARTLPRGPDGAARVAVLLGDSALAAAAPTRQIIEKYGLRAVRLEPLGSAVQVVVETDQPARVRSRELLSAGRYVATLIEVDLGGLAGAGAVASPRSGVGEDGLPVAELGEVDPWIGDPQAVEALQPVENHGLPKDAELLSWLSAVSLGRAPERAARSLSRPLVVIDAGHGGHDHGAVGPSGAREADIALQIARRTGWLLRETYDVDVVFTREDDRYLGLRARAAVANQRDADLFLSVHINAAPGPEAQGVESYVLDTASDEGAARVAARENRELGALGEDLSQNDALMASLVVAGTDRLSLGLAADLQRRVLAAHGQGYGPGVMRDLGVKGAMFTVLASARCPAVLFEAGFISNPEEERRLRSPFFHQQTAEALAAGVSAWLSTSAKRPAPGAPVPQTPGVIRLSAPAPEAPPVLGLPTRPPGAPVGPP